MPLVIYNFVFSFIHTLSFMITQSVPVVGIHLFLQGGQRVIFILSLSVPINKVGIMLIYLLILL